MKPLALLIVLLICGSAFGQFANVSFETDQVTLSEGQANVRIGVQVDGPGNYGGVLIESADGTATANDDYSPISVFLLWQADDSDPQYLDILTVDDGPGEGPETFTVNMTGFDGLNPGSITSVEVTITEGGGLTAAFVIPEGIPQAPGGDYWIPVNGGADLPVLLRLSELPPAPVTVEYLVGDDPTPVAVEFDGIQEQTVIISSPPQPVDGPIASRYVRIIDGSSAKRRAIGEGFWTGFFYDGDTNGLAGCSACAMRLLLAQFGFSPCDDGCAWLAGGSCPYKAEDAWITTLQRYRDELLTQTPGGNYFAELYQELSHEIIIAMLQKPRLIYDIVDASGPWITAIGDLLDGAGSMTITPAMEADLLALMQDIRDNGSANLDSRLDQELTRLHADGPLSGLTMVQFQQRVESVGAGVSVEESSWSRLKARFGQ